jgi:hypothetical protein
MDRASNLRGLALAATLVAGALAGCAPEAVRWDEGLRANVSLAGARLVIGADGRPMAGTIWTPPSTPQSKAMCPASLAATRGRADTAFAAWWSPRSEGAADLVVARSDDGGRSWHQPVVADSADRARTGCRREPPAITADSLDGYVHVVYFLVAPEGPGVFCTHSMEGGAMFHAPVPVVYGERSSAAAVASWGDTVAVAYQDPNSSVPQVWLALSHSTGHIFEQRTSVSSASVSAARPAVALRSDRIAVAWLETARGGGPGTTVVRSGTIRR